MAPRTLHDLPTPCLLLDLAVLERNLDRMRKRAQSAGVDLQPHCKTAKSAEVARRATAGFSGGITVATFNEAEYFLRNGFRDITYAVCVEPGKFPRIASLLERGARVRAITDNVEVARALAEYAPRFAASLRVLVEIDAGLHRTGLPPDSPDVIEIARILQAAGNLAFEGVLTYGGKSYSATSLDAIRDDAEAERKSGVTAAERIRAAGIPCPVVSAGSTPTMTFATSLEGITEIRAGVYVFMDLMQVTLGVCTHGDIAVTVLASVVSQQRSVNRVYIDAGALALSKDLGIARPEAVHAPYGLIRGSQGSAPRPNLGVTQVNQEHGFLTSLDDATAFPFAEFPVGKRVRVLPNHVCHTIGAHDRYYVIDEHENVIDEWERTVGW